MPLALAITAQSAGLVAALGFALAVAMPPAASAAASAASAQPTALTLDEALAAAREASPALAAARLSRAEAAARTTIAGQRPNPELALEEARDTPRDVASVALPLELGAKRRQRLALAAAQAQGIEADIARQEAAVRSQTRHAYFALAAAQRRAAETAAIQHLAEGARDAARTRFDAGDVPRLDVLQAELAVEQAAAESDKSRGALTAARAALATLLARPPDAPLLAAADLDVGRVPAGAVAVDLAQRSSVELEVLDRGIAQQQAQLQLARSAAVPDLTVGAGVTHRDLPEFNWGWRGSLTIALPVFTRASKQIQLEQATLARLQAERAAAAAQLRGEVFAAAETAGVDRGAYRRFQDQILPRAAEVESMAEDSYRSGQTGLAALLQTLQTVHDLRLQSVQAGLDYQNALADLERAIGAPLP